MLRMLHIVLLRYSRVLALGGIVMLLLAAFRPAYQEMEAPISVQNSVFLKALSFDKQFNIRIQEKIVIGVVYQELYRPSLNAQKEYLSLQESLVGKRVKGRFVELVPIVLDNEGQWKEQLLKNDVNVIYITPLRSFDLSSLTDFSREQKLITFTGVRNQCAQGVSTAIGMRGNKPQIIINLEAAKMEGTEYSSQLLKLAKVI